ncbi:MAG: CerR family C-terminal domain-containing protein [Deltaproteobacteria bacterium]|nr:CerR family C-terminal domain-containing protein [Deltaproteobacteria bacterium]
MRARSDLLQISGETTRQRLIDAALEVFGEFGFDGASTRMLADKADANLAAIPYHFGSKEGLYCAAAQYIVDRMAQHTAPLLEQIEHALRRAPLPRSQALELLHKYTDTLIAILVGSPETDGWAAFIMREQLQPGAAFDVLYDGMMRRIGDAGAGLLASIFKLSKGDPSINLKEIAILGQILVFRTCRQTALRRLGWKDFSIDRLKQIQSLIREHVDLIVAGAV